MPHDLVVEGLLERLGVPHIEATAPLMEALYFRHVLSEPLACGVRDWWSAFSRKYILVEEIPSAAGAAISLRS